MKASETVGKVLKKGDIVVYESTVYPGVTEDICAPVLSKVSGLARADFKLGWTFIVFTLVSGGGVPLICHRLPRPCRERAFAIRCVA